MPLYRYRCPYCEGVVECISKTAEVVHACPKRPATARDKFVRYELVE